MNEKINLLAKRHQVSPGAVEVLITALQATGGNSAQFNHPDLGGMGQWMPGMVMVSDMFNSALKAKVTALITDILALMPEVKLSAAGKSGIKEVFGGGIWWPKSLGTPASSGAQNAMRYAYFPDVNRLAIKLGERVMIYDTAGYRITGISQQQNSQTEQSILFSTPRGNFDLTVLKRIQVVE